MSHKPVNQKNYYSKLQKAMEGLPIHDSKAIEMASKYVIMSDNDFNSLPAFAEDGQPQFYDIAGILMGKATLKHFVNTIKNR